MPKEEDLEYLFAFGVSRFASDSTKKEFWGALSDRPELKKLAGESGIPLEEILRTFVHRGEHRGRGFWLDEIPEELKAYDFDWTGLAEKYKDEKTRVHIGFAEIRAVIQNQGAFYELDVLHLAGEYLVKYSTYDPKKKDLRTQHRNCRKPIPYSSWP